ncbi:MAG: hypothetical protein IJ852_03505 [Alphaproteobacteria bacterium]|nr:hypothetical protein [Alphaproteobacteria bacterium]
MFICGVIFACVSAFALPTVAASLLLLLIFHVYYFKKADVVGISIKKSCNNRRLHNIGLFLKEFLFLRPNRQNSGYVLILVAAFIPVVLLGVKYSEQMFKLKDNILKKGATSVDVSTIEKRCAREAALAVAQNWNPGLTLGQQREGVYKVADAVYNANPCYQLTAVGSAIPGMNIRDYKGNAVENLQPSLKTVSYTSSTLYFPQHYFYESSGRGNPYYMQWLVVDKATAPANRSSKFDSVTNFSLNQHDICIEPHPYYSYTDHSSYPNDTYFYAASNSYSYPRYNLPSTSSTSFGNYSSSNISTTHLTQSSSYNSSYAKSNGTYTTRVASNYVKIEVYGDKIKATTDNQTACATPAQCNVDIVLAVPVNGAACNANNRDAASDTAGTPYYYNVTNYTIPSDAKSTPIYQMGQALKNFVKDNWYHTRGVYMSLIPYSGKLSIPLERATTWTVAFPKFVNTATSVQKIIGACLYGTSGVKDAALTQVYKTSASGSGLTLPTTDTPYYWGSVLTGCPIMFRAGTATTDGNYGSNQYFSGLLLNTTSPSSGASYKYLRMNLNPCYGGYANMLSMRCERKCTHFLPNPYYIIEPTADLVKIYEMCNALFPIYDIYNVSNFVFLPLEWANNMFQSWTNNPSVSTTAGTGDSAVLSRPSKTTSGRKKAIILLVNKPDWFEPGELTYLGFDNDAAEIPMTESDKIDFSINYSDTSKKFLDGSAYNGTIAGPKKILKYETTNNANISYSNSYYQGSGRGHLTFPHKGTIKLVVAPADGASSSSGGSGSITFYSDNIGSTYDVRKDSTSGTSISLDTAQPVS